MEFFGLKGRNLLVYGYRIFPKDLSIKFAESMEYRVSCFIVSPFWTRAQVHYFEGIKVKTEYPLRPAAARRFLETSYSNNVPKMSLSIR